MSGSAPPSSEEGFTLTELLIVMVVLGIVSTIVVVMFTRASESFLRADDESVGLGEAKTVLDRVSRDIRESRGIVCNENLDDPNPCASQLEIWLDQDSDYAQDPEEVVTWSVVPNEDGVHFDVLRSTSAGEERVVARSVVQDTLFEYDTEDPNEATMVTITATYDARENVGNGEKSASTTVRIRNG